MLGWIIRFIELARRFWPLWCAALLAGLLIEQASAAEPPAPPASAPTPAQIEPVGFAGCIRSAAACTCHDTRGRVMGAPPGYCADHAGTAGPGINLTAILPQYRPRPVAGDSPRFERQSTPAKPSAWLGRFPYEVSP